MKINEGWQMMEHLYKIGKQTDDYFCLISIIKIHNKIKKC